MHVEAVPYQREIYRHAQALREWQKKADKIGKQEAAEIEMHLLACALYLRKLDEHKYLPKGQISGQSVKLVDGKSLGLADICHVLIHSQLITTDAKSVASNVQIQSDRSPKHEIEFERLLGVIEGYGMA